MKLHRPQPRWALRALLALTLTGLAPWMPPWVPAWVPPSIPQARADQAPILETDPGGHQGIIRDLLVTADRRTLVTASDDKTVRVWDAQSGRELRRILGDIGPGPEGKVYAIALSTDDRWLAVAGFLDRDGAEGMGRIRLYDFATGRLVQVLKGHTGKVADLAFSPDGAWLVSGGFDLTVRVWDARRGFALDRTLKGHDNAVYAVALLPDGQVVSAGYDNQVLLWRGDQVQARHRHDHQLQFLAVSRDRIAASGYQDQAILIFDHGLRLKKTLTGPTNPSGLAFAPDGHRLAAGTGRPPYVCVVYDARIGFAEQARFSGHDNAVSALAFLDDRTLVSGGGDNQDLYRWGLDGKGQAHWVGQGRSVWEVGLEAGALRWGHVGKSDPHLNANPLGQRLDLETWQRGEAQGDAGVERIATSWTGDGATWTLDHGPGGDYGKPDATLNIRRDGQAVASVTRQSTDGYRHRTYGFTPGGLVVSGGASGFLTLYDRQGRTLARLVGHTGDLWSLAARGHWLVSGSADQTLRLWNLDLIGTAAQPKDLDPVLSLFPAADGEWVAWTPQGYYAASPQGDKYFGFHLNHGPDRAAEFVAAGQYQALYRPDILRLAWETGSAEAAIAAAAKTQRTEPVDVLAQRPPRIELVRPTGPRVSTAADRLEVEYCVVAEGQEPIAEMGLLLNGRPLDGQARGLARMGGGERRQCRTETLTLAPDLARQTITIQARNRHASATPVILEVERERPAAPAYRPDLYVLSVGVSRYGRQGLNLGLAAGDAQAVGEAFGAQRDLFNAVKVRTLVDAQASRDAVLDGLDWIGKESTQRDLSVIFIAGHGVNDDQNNYYFLPADADPDGLRRSAVRWNEISDLVKNLPGKVLLLVDTCHSGNVFGDTRRRTVAADITAAIKTLVDAGTGQVIMTAATGSTPSLEDPAWGHGAFTAALLEGLKGKADSDGDGSVTIKELDLYVTRRVKDLTGGRQKPTTIIPSSVPDFAVATGR